MSNDELARAIGRIEGNVEAILAQLLLKDARLDSHGSRISKLEKWQAWTFGAGATIGVVFGVLWPLFTQVLRGR